MRKIWGRFRWRGNQFQLSTSSLRSWSFVDFFSVTPQHILDGALILKWRFWQILLKATAIEYWIRGSEEELFPLFASISIFISLNVEKTRRKWKNQFDWHLASSFVCFPYSSLSSLLMRASILHVLILWQKKKFFLSCIFPRNENVKIIFIFSLAGRERESWWSLSTVKFKQQRAAAVRMKTTSGPTEQCGHTNILQIVPICAIFKFHSVSRLLTSTSVISSQQSSPRSWMCNAADLDEIRIGSRRWLQRLS